MHTDAFHTWLIMLFLFLKEAQMENVIKQCVFLSEADED